MKRFFFGLICFLSASCWAANIEMDDPGIGLSNTIAVCTVSFLVGWGVKSYMESTGKYSVDTTTIVAVLAGLFGGPILSYIMFF